MKKKETMETKIANAPVFQPNTVADIKYIIFDMFREKDSVTSLEVYDELVRKYNAPVTCVGVNDVLCHFCTSGLISQTFVNDTDYHWGPIMHANAEEQSKAAKPKETKKPKTPKVATPTKEAAKSKFAEKHVLESEEKGKIEMYTIMPDKYVKDEWPGYWVGTSDEAMEVFLLPKELKITDVKSIICQLVNCDEESVTVKKNF